MISHKNQFIVLSSPRTGASAFALAYGEYLTDLATSSGDPTQHQEIQNPFLTVEEAKEKWASYWDSYDKYTIVRNPWDKILSTYCYFKQTKNLPDRHQANKLGFEEWVKEVVFTDTKVSNYFKDQTNWYIDPDTGKYATNIIYYENMQARYDYFAKKYNLIPMKLPVVNKSKRHKSYKRYYSDDITKDIIYEMYHKDVQALEYIF